MKLIDSKPRGAYLSILHPDGRVVDVVPLTIGRARITISQSQQSIGWDDGW